MALARGLNKKMVKLDLLLDIVEFIHVIPLTSQYRFSIYDQIMCLFHNKLCKAVSFLNFRYIQIHITPLNTGRNVLKKIAYHFKH